MLTTKFLKSKGVKIPKGWRVIRVGEIMGNNWKYLFKITDIENIEELAGKDFIVPAKTQLQAGVRTRIQKNWRNNTIYIKPKNL